MECKQIFAELAQQSGGIVTAKAAQAHGISRAMLSKLYQAGDIERIAKGQYILPDGLQDDLLSISHRSRRIILSHETALYLHGLSDRTPFVHSITVPSGQLPSTALKKVCKVYFIKPELFELGRTQLPSSGGNVVPVYDLERTVCDLIRSRSRVGTETFSFAMKAYAASSKNDLNKLYAYAKELRVMSALRTYLEVLL